MLEQIRILLDAARYRKTQADNEDHDGRYFLFTEARRLVEALEAAECAAENYERAKASLVRQ